MLIQAPISLGELIDKITILEIKAVNIADPAKLKNVTHELAVLDAKVSELLGAEGQAKLSPLKKACGTLIRNCGSLRMIFAIVNM